MDNFFLRWLNKPKADDKSLLARFYHADRSLTAVASELDSFDGRAEPERCSRLVGRLRQGQDRVLSIVNLIMDELLGEDRAPRTFRAKFPEEVLQESLAGQLWFGAECLAAGSSIMNHEEESSNMRPLARAVTKSLVNVRNMLREQCLRHNIPNSPTLKLDINDSTTETLYESLKIFDRLFADFEYQYVSAMVPVKTEHEHEVQELICVLFSESLQRALKLGLLEQDQVDAFDPALMFSIPRLAIVSGLVIFDHNGPLNMDQPAELLSEMFRPFRKLLLRMRELLRTLNKNELFQLEKLLCTNEEINLKTQFIICDDADNDAAKTDNGGAADPAKQQSVHNNNNNNNEVVKTPTESSLNTMNRSSTNGSVNNNRYTLNSYNSDNSSNNNSRSNCIEDDTLTEWANDDEVDPTTADDGDTVKEGLVTADCASGFLIPNTNFGNLLQPTEAPLTDSFISSDDEYTSVNDVVGCSDTPSASSLTKKPSKKRGADSGIGTDANASLDQSPELETRKSLDETTPREEGRRSSEGFRRRYSENWENLEKEQPGCSKSQAPVNSSDEDSEHTICDNPTTSRSRAKGTESSGGVEKVHRSSAKRSERRHHHHHHKGSAASSSSSVSVAAARKRKSSRHTNLESSSSGDTSPTSEGDAKEVALALRAAGRMKFKTTENLLHRLFVCIAGVADQLQTNFASDLRQILKSVFLINTTPVEEDLHIDTKRKDSDLFEFRPSDSDVIQQQENNAGSNQSIYSTAEEVNPETEDSVFDDRNGNAISSSLDHESDGVSRGSGILQMGRSVSLGDSPLDRHEASPTTTSQGIAIAPSKNNSNMGRSRSTGGSPLYGRNSPDDSNTSSHGSHECIISHEEPLTPPPTVTSASPIAASNRRTHVRQVESPPRWIPDGEAPRCMACAAVFNPFRRRHHCRNCGGVFCSVCSSLSAPLPKYGLVKAVRVCRDCYVRNVAQPAH